MNLIQIQTLVEDEIKSANKEYEMNISKKFLNKPLLIEGVTVQKYML